MPNTVAMQPPQKFTEADLDNHVEQLIDLHSVVAMLASIERTIETKITHILEDWQDPTTALRRWRIASHAITKARKSVAQCGV